MTSISIFDVANYILNKKGSMTAMKLQKLAYYAQAWSIVWDEEELYKEGIQAWANGPVVKELYKAHRGEFCLMLLVTLFVGSCSAVVSSPSVRLENSSSDGSKIRNIKVIWNGYHLLKESGPYNVCNRGGGQSFGLKKTSDFFGLVHAEWQNAKGEKISKDFKFNKSDFPSFAKGEKYRPFEYPYIILFFTQSDLEYYTSDNPRIKDIEWEKSGNWINKWFEKEGVRKCVNDPKEVKRVRSAK